MKIEKYFVTKNDCYRSGQRCEKIGLQLHTIGTAQNSAKAVADYWNQPGIEACVHYIVDAEQEGKVLQLLPEDYRAWADAGYGNDHLLTFEIAESDSMRYTSGASFSVTDEAKFRADILRGYRTAVAFCAVKCKAYGWNPKGRLGNGLYVISSHDEGRKMGVSSAHVDPTHVWSRLGLTMEQFRKDVAAEMRRAAGKEEPDKGAGGAGKIKYRVGTSWNKKKQRANHQHGAFLSLANAKRDARTAALENKRTYRVFDRAGKRVYTAKYKAGSKASA